MLATERRIARACAILRLIWADAPRPLPTSQAIDLALAIADLPITFTPFHVVPWRGRA